MVDRITKLMRRYDLDKDGEVDDDELADIERILEIEFREEKARTQKAMAWTAFVLMTVFTVLLFSPIMTDSRVDALSDLLGLFYIAQAGIVGAYMGVTAWMSKDSDSGYGGYGGYGRGRRRYGSTGRSNTMDTEEPSGR